MRRVLLIACIVLFAASGAEAEWITLASDTRPDGTNSSTAYAARVAPGQPLANDTSVFPGGAAGISIQYYLAGTDGRTVQVYRTAHDLRAGGGGERRPILLARAEDGSAVLRFIAFSSGTEFTLRIRPRSDGTFAITPVK
jgi:hypothetical protein